MAAYPIRWNSWRALILLVPALGQIARAQIDQVLPEIDVYHRLSSNVRFGFQAKETREGGVPTQAEIGPSFDFYLKPLVKLEKLTWFMWTI